MFNLSPIGATMPKNLTSLLGSPLFLWTLLALPSVGMVASGMDYGQVMHASGEFSARLLILSLAVSPLLSLFPGRAWGRWLLRRRRWIGVAAFGYGVLHTLFYLIEVGAWSAVAGDLMEAGIWTGWLAFLLFVPPALTSNDASVRRLGRRWKPLQRMVYGAALLTLLHWALVADHWLPALVNFAPLMLLQLARVLRNASRARRHVAPSTI
jgi:sulfoxide reductase heme-binding subunit YedZ